MPRTLRTVVPHTPVTLARRAPQVFSFAEVEDDGVRTSTWMPLPLSVVPVLVGSLQDVKS